MTTLRQKLQLQDEFLDGQIYRVLETRYGETPLCQTEVKISTNIRGKTTFWVKCISLGRFYTEQTFSRKCLVCQEYMKRELESRGYYFDS